MRRFASIPSLVAVLGALAFLPTASGTESAGTSNAGKSSGARLEEESKHEGHEAPHKHAEKCRCSGSGDCTCKKGQCRCKNCNNKGHKNRVAPSVVGKAVVAPSVTPVRAEARAGIFL